MSRVITKAFILDDGKVISESTLRQSQVQGRKAGETTEIHDKSKTRTSEFVEPPLEFAQLSSLLERSTPQYRSVKAKAGDAAARGWFLEPKEKDGTASEENRTKLETFLNDPSNKGQALESILENFLIDFESQGNGALELVKDEKGVPLELNHIPAKTILRSKDFKKFIHERGRQSVFYKPIGAEEEVNKDTGEVGDFDFITRANELIYKIKYSPNSDFYGMADVVPALRAVTGDIFQKEFNLSFFENGAIPQYLVIIEGAELDETLEKIIEDFFKRELKGVDNQHRTMILPVPIEGVEIKIEKLTPDISEGSFRLFHETAVDEILSANGVPPLRAFLQKSGAFGRDQSREQNKIYKESIIKPLQKMIEAFMNKWIVREGFGITDWVFRLEPLEFEERELMSLAAERLAKTGAVSPNELRRFIKPLIPGDLDPVDGGDTLSVEVGGVPTPLPTVFPPDSEEKASHDAHGWKALYDPDLFFGEAVLAEWDGSKADDGLRIMIDAVEPIVERLTVLLKKEFSAAEAAILRNLTAAAGGKVLVFLGKQKPISVTAVLKDFGGTERAVEKVIVEQAEAGYKSGIELAERRLRVDISFRLQRPAVQRYLDQIVTPFSKNITSGISNRIRRQLSRGIAEGESLSTLKKRVSKVFKGVTTKRALLIARTETARAHNVGTIGGYRQSNIVKQVEVSDGLDFDAPCVQANGSKWSLELAETNPIQHPNCIRAFIPIRVPAGERA